PSISTSAGPPPGPPASRSAASQIDRKRRSARGQHIGVENPDMRSNLALAAALAALFGAGSASALTLPFTEDFASDVSGWEDAGNAPLTWNEAGGPDGSSYASTTFSYLGFENPFGGGPVIFRA